MHSKVDYKRERSHKSLTTGIYLQGKYITYVLILKYDFFFLFLISMSY